MRTHPVDTVSFHAAYIPTIFSQYSHNIPTIFHNSPTSLFQYSHMPFPSLTMWLCLASHVDLFNQVRAMHNPCSMIVSHFGEDLPFPEGFFDRVLCDVPCSGDGTIRKSPNMKWRSARSVPLHCVQVNLCVHSLQLLVATYCAICGR
jgi:hypothetical protein